MLGCIEASMAGMSKWMVILVPLPSSMGSRVVCPWTSSGPLGVVYNDDANTLPRLELDNLHCALDRGTNSRVPALETRADAHGSLRELLELHVGVPPWMVTQVVHGVEIKDD